MAAPSKAFTVIPDSDVDPDSPITTGLMTELRDNDIHLEEWLGLSYVAAQDHDHDGVNSALVNFEDNVDFSYEFFDGFGTGSTSSGSYASVGSNVRFILPKQAKYYHRRFNVEGNIGSTGDIRIRVENDGGSAAAVNGSATSVVAGTSIVWVNSGDLSAYQGARGLMIIQMKLNSGSSVDLNADDANTNHLGWIDKNSSEATLGSLT